MKDKQETEVYAYEPICVYFKELAYSRTIFSISHGNFYVEFQLREKSIDDIQDALLRFCDAYEIDWEMLMFETSKEILNRISLKTLASEKTVRELLEVRRINLKEKTNESLCR
jgi:hypothetical protein